VIHTCWKVIHVSKAENKFPFSKKERRRSVICIRKKIFQEANSIINWECQEDDVKPCGLINQKSANRIFQTDFFSKIFSSTVENKLMQIWIGVKFNGVVMGSVRKVAYYQWLDDGETAAPYRIISRYKTNYNGLNTESDVTLRIISFENKMFVTQST
jgi:hypothetical protein